MTGLLTDFRDAVRALAKAPAFAGDPGVVGRKVTFSGVPATVVGVMPPHFRVLTAETELWAPLNFDPSVDWRTASGRFMTVIGRLHAGTMVEQTQRELDAVAQRLAAEYPKFNASWGVNVVPIREQIVGSVRAPLAVLAGVVAFVLLIACANVASLQLARATGRRQEFAVRTALGADGWQIARTVVAEALALAAVGGAAGLLIGWWSVTALAAAGPRNLPRLDEVGLDARVVAFTVVLALVTGLVFGVAPALHAARGNLGAALKQGGRGSAGGHQRVRSALVGTQAALALVLLIGAALMLKSFARLQEVDPGFAADGVLTARLTLPASRYATDPQRAQLFDQVVSRIQGLPGVRAAGAVSYLPLTGMASSTSVTVENRPLPPGAEAPITEVRIVTGDYFRALGIPLVRGAVLTGHEAADAPKQVVVSAAFAARMLPNEDPIGKRIELNWGDLLPATIVGVVGDVRHSGLDSVPKPMTYWSLPQFPTNRVTLVVRHGGVAAAGVAAGLRQAVHEIDPALPVAEIKSMDEYVSESVAQRRLNTSLLAAFAGAALLLAAVGIYGVVAYSVAQRTRELGLRVALGAQRGAVLRIVIGQGMKLVLVGSVAGMVGAVILSRVLTRLLYDVSPTDAATFVIVPLLLAAVSALACDIPARRATRVDAIIALHAD